MTDIVDKSEFVPIPLIEEGVKVKGGINGPTNVPLIALANRTLWLREQIEANKGINGGVFIVDITPQNVSDNVGNKVLNEDTVSLMECLSTTASIKVKVLALSGHTKFRPTVTVNGVAVQLVAKADAPLFEGTVSITRPTDGLIKAIHEDGASWVTEVKMDAAPLVTAATFKSVYPAGQTEAKAGDVFSVGFVANTPVVGYEIENFGALEASSGTFVAATTGTITGRVVADRGTSTQALGFRIRVQKATGAWSPWYTSTAGGAVDLTNTVKLNNLYPTITFGAITYPAGQSGLKGVEAATINHTIINQDTVQYASTELTIAAPTAYVPAKSVSRLGGTYNVTTKNFNVTAKRTANGATTTDGVVVAIADAAPTIAVSTPAARLRSGGNSGTVAQDHTITITSSQALEEAPTMNAPEGTWVEGVWTGNAAKTVWTRKLRVHDDNAKGTFSWNSLSAKSKSGRVVTAITTGPSYVLGGFVFRTLSVAAYPNREAVIGTKVSDTSKLRSTNLAKGDSGSLNFTYQGSTVAGVNKFSITGPTGVFNAAGTLWYNNDGSNATSNTTGTMRVELEEVV